MAQNYIINVSPKLNSSDAQRMETDLNKRFKRVADKFGGALKTVGSKLKGVLAGATAGVVAAIVTNPYDELSSKLDETTGKAAELMDKAVQYNVSAGKLFMAQQLLESKGVKDFDTILDRFAVKLEQARTGESATLKEFTNEKDIVDALFIALQSIGQLSGEEQAKMLQEIFGGRQGFALAPVASEDLKARSELVFGSQRPEDFDEIIRKLDEVADYRDITRAWLAQEQLQMNAGAITKNAVNAQRSVEFQRAVRQSQQFAEMETYAKVANEMSRVAESTDELKNTVLEVVAPVISEINDTTKELKENIKKRGAWQGIKTTFWGNE